MGGRAATGGIIEAPMEEKDVEMDPVTIAKKFDGQPINHDEIAWEQNIDSIVMSAKDHAKEELDQDPDPIEMVGVSLDCTSQVGTYSYTASEIEEGWPNIDEKSDIHHLRAVFLELWQ